MQNVKQNSKRCPTYKGTDAHSSIPVSEKCHLVTSSVCAAYVSLAAISACTHPVQTQQAISGGAETPQTGWWMSSVL